MATGDAAPPTSSPTTQIVEGVAGVAGENIGQVVGTAMGAAGGPFGSYVGGVLGAGGGGLVVGTVEGIVEGKNLSDAVQDGLSRGFNAALGAAVGGVGGKIFLGEKILSHVPLGKAWPTAVEDLGKKVEDFKKAEKLLGDAWPSLNQRLGDAVSDVTNQERIVGACKKAAEDAEAALSRFAKDNPGESGRTQHLQHGLREAQVKLAKAEEDLIGKQAIRDRLQQTVDKGEGDYTKDLRTDKDGKEAAKVKAEEVKNKLAKPNLLQLKVSHDLLKLRLGMLGGDIALWMYPREFPNILDDDMLLGGFPKLPIITIGGGDLSQSNFGWPSEPGNGLIDPAIGKAYPAGLDTTQMMCMRKFPESIFGVRLGTYRIPQQVEAGVANFLGVILPYHFNNVGQGLPVSQLEKQLGSASFNQSQVDLSTAFIASFRKPYLDVQHNLITEWSELQQKDAHVRDVYGRLGQDVLPGTRTVINNTGHEMTRYSDIAAPPGETQASYVLQYTLQALKKFESDYNTKFGDVDELAKKVKENTSTPNPNPLGKGTDGPVSDPNEFDKRLADLRKRNNDLGRIPAGEKPTIPAKVPEVPATPRVPENRGREEPPPRFAGGGAPRGRGGAGADSLIPALLASGALGGGAGQGRGQGGIPDEPDDDDPKKKLEETTDNKAEKVAMLPPVGAAPGQPGAPGQAGGPPPPGTPGQKPDQTGAPPPAAVRPDGRQAVVLSDGSTIWVYPDVAVAITAALADPLHTDAQLAYSHTAAAWPGDFHNAGPRIDPANLLKDGGDIAVFQVEAPTGGESLRPKNRPGATADGSAPAPQDAIVQAGFERKTGGNGAPPSAGKVVATHTAIVIVRGDANADPNVPAAPGGPAQVEIIFNGQVIPFAPDQWEDQAKNHKATPDPKVTPDPKGGAGDKGNDAKGGSGVKGNDPKKSTDPKGAPDPRAVPEIKDPGSLGKFAGFIHPKGIQIPSATPDPGAAPPPPASAPDQAPPPPAAAAAVWA